MVEVTQADRDAVRSYTRGRVPDVSPVPSFEDTLGEAFARSRIAGWHAGRVAERDAVVKWLQRMQGNAGKWSPMEQTVAAACRYLADAIEAGEPFK